MLKVNNVKVNYGQAIALSNVSLEVNQGELIAVIGSNGAGKTTLVNALKKLPELKKLEKEKPKILP